MHTVAEVGYWREPKILAFAARVKNPDAGAWNLRLREFVLTHGDDFGRLKGYTADEIAVVMAPTCPPRLLFKALADFGLLKRKRRHWYVPDWRTSPMGRYCQLRAWDRERKQELREARHAARLEEATGGTSDGSPPDVRGTSSGKSAVSKKAVLRTSPPGPPQKGGSVAKGATRWEWFSQNHPRIRASEKCRRLLERLTDDQWQHVQWSLPRQASSSAWKKNMRFVPWADRYLEREQWLEIPMPSAAEQKARKAEDAKRSKLTPAEQQAEKKAAATKFILELLADPDLPKAEKEKRQAEHEKTWGERPWEKARR